MFNLFFSSIYGRYFQTIIENYVIIDHMKKETFKCGICHANFMIHIFKQRLKSLFLRVYKEKKHSNVIFFKLVSYQNDLYFHFY